MTEKKNRNRFAVPIPVLSSLCSKFPHAFQQAFDLFCYFFYFRFQSQQFLAVHLIFLFRIQYMYRLDQKRSGLRLKLLRQMRFL